MYSKKAIDFLHLGGRKICAVWKSQRAFFYIYEASSLKEVVIIFKKFQQHLYEMVKRNGYDRPWLTFMFYKLGIQAQKINLL